MGFKRRNRGLFPNRAKNRANEARKQGQEDGNKGRIGEAGGLPAADGAAGGGRGSGYEPVAAGADTASGAPNRAGLGWASPFPGG